MKHDFEAALNLRLAPTIADSLSDMEAFFAQQSRELTKTDSWETMFFQTLAYIQN